MTTYDERDVAIMANVVFHGLCELDEVRLTGLGRENCAKGIDIPRSDIQRLGDYLGE